MTTELDLTLPDGRLLHVYDTEGPGLPVLWHHGTPNVGLLPEPLVAASARLGVRWVSYDRPGYGGSSFRPGRDVASSVTDVAALADALGLDRFAVMAHSGGGPYVLACLALLPERATAGTVLAGPAPFDAEGLDWFGGLAASQTASLRAAATRRAAKEAYEGSGAGHDLELLAVDDDVLEGDWGEWVFDATLPAMVPGPAARIDDDMAFVSPWGFDPGQITAPVLFVHGALDRVVPPAHSTWLAGRCPAAELRLFSDHGHLSILREAPGCLEWLTATADR